MQGKHLYEFGPYHLDSAERLLRRGSEAVPLTPKVFETLLALVERGGHVLSKDELLRRVWPDTVVEEANLAQNVHTLRRILAVGANGQDYIETVPKVGYRFTAKLKVTIGTMEARVTGPAAEARRRPGWVMALAVVAVLSLAGYLSWRSVRPTPVSPRRIMLGVLPFENLSGDPGQEYFADGLTEEMIAQLSQLHAGRLGVIARTSAMKYKGRAKSAQDIGRELGVNYVLEGSVRRSGERVRITVQLIQLPDQTHLWSKTYEPHVRDILALQNDVAQAVAAEIHLKLTPEARARLGRRQVVRPEAYEAYLKGRYFWNKRTVEGLHRAVNHFQQAVEEDPEYALAYSGLADAHLLYGYFPELPVHEARARAFAAATRALTLDETLAEAQTSLAFIHTHFDWNWRAAETEFERAIELNPNYATAHHWYAYYWVSQGRMKEALAEIHLARELDPLSLIINTDVAEMFYYSRQHDQAIEQALKVLQMDPSFVLGRQILAWAYLEKHGHAEAIRELKAAISAPGRQGDQLTSLVASLGVAYAKAGRRAEAREVLTEVKAAPGEGALLQMAWLYLALGEHESALASLEEAYQQRAGSLILLKAYPFLEPLHSDPRFQDLVRRVGLPP